MSNCLEIARNGMLCAGAEEYEQRIEELEAGNKKAIELAEDFMNANDVGDYVIPVHLATYLCDDIIKALKGEGDA